MNQLNGKYVFQYFKDEAKREARREIVLNLYQEGDSIARIARIIGFPEAEVMQWILENHADRTAAV